MGRRHRSSQKHLRADDAPDHFEDLKKSLLARPRAASPVALRPPVRKLKEVEDRRRWDPDVRKPPRALTGRHARIVHKVKATSRSNAAVVKPLARVRRQAAHPLIREAPSFGGVRKAIICIKRKVRREVLHALMRTRSGKGSPKKRNEWSDVQC